MTMAVINKCGLPARDRTDLIAVIFVSREESIGNSNSSLFSVKTYSGIQYR